MFFIKKTFKRYVTLKKGDIMEINDVISLLETKRNVYEKDINIINNGISKINEAFSNNTVYDINKLNDLIDILEKYDGGRFLISRYTKEDLKLYCIKLTNGNLLARFIIKKILKNINMTGKHFNDYQSFKELINGLCDIEHYFSKINIAKNSNNTFIKREFNMSENTLKAIIMSYYNNFKYSLDLICRKLIKINNKYKKMIKLVSLLDGLDINDDPNKYKGLVEEYSALLRKNEELSFKETNELNIYFRIIVKDYDGKQRSNEVEPLYKYGTRQERLEQHEKDKIEENLNILINQMDLESKMWFEMVAEQIKTSNDATIMEYINSPMTCLPGEKEVDKDTFNLIVSAVIEDLKFTDKDKYKEMINSLIAIKK